jgi:hypothetical protein
MITINSYKYVAIYLHITPLHVVHNEHVFPDSLYPCSRLGWTPKSGLVDLLI